MEEYSGNSLKTRNEPEMVTPVVSGASTVKKNKLNGAKVDSDIIPTIKKIMSLGDIVIDILKILTGEERSSKRSYYEGGIPVSRVSYQSFYDAPYEPQKKEDPMYKAEWFDDIIVESEEKADELLRNVADIIRDYKKCSIMTYYSLAKLTAPFTGRYYGWTSMEGFEKVRTRKGVVIKAPMAYPL